MKTVYFFGGNHPANEAIIKNPPPGYHIISNVPITVFENVNRVREYDFKKKLEKKFLDICFRILAEPRSIIITKPCDGIHTIGGAFPLNGIPHVIEVEYASSFFGFYDEWNEHPAMVRALIHRLSNPLCKQIIAYSEASRRTLINSLPVDTRSFLSRKCTTIWPAVPERILKYHANPGTHDTLKVLFVGNHFFDKGGRELVYAIDKIHRKLDVQLDLVTKAPPHHAEYFENFKRVWSQKEFIHFHKDVDRDYLFSELYSKADLFVFPTYMDMVPYSILEAMGVGLPIVASDCFALPDMIEENVTGKIIHAPITSFPHEGLRTKATLLRYRESVVNEKLFSGVVEALSVAIQNLLESTGDLKRIGSNCRKVAEEGKFSLLRRNSALKEVYDGAF
jgi:glycosyltransferase involved in cell wall biosynthesis